MDFIYSGGRKGHAGDDPLTSLMGVSNQGGFRIRGQLKSLKFVVLVTSFNDSDWPDSLDRESGVITYFGDNKQPQDMDETSRNGNNILKKLFNDAEASDIDRKRLPPVFVFEKTGTYRDVRFLGLAVPQITHLAPSEALVAIWRTARGERFQNYRARFTILDVPMISRIWINDLIAGQDFMINAPTAWQEWINTRIVRALKAPRTTTFRTKEEQIPKRKKDIEIIQIIYNHFKDNAYKFEAFAAKIAKLMLPAIDSIDITRPSRDGGRDAVGKYKIGQGPGSISVDFSLEAKCYSMKSSVGVKDMARLISRLRHRQFGVLVTTSFVSLQVYKEIRDDEHPIVVVSALDIVQVVQQHLAGDPETLQQWLLREFPQNL